MVLVMFVVCHMLIAPRLLLQYDLPEQCLLSLCLSVDGECFCVCSTFLLGFHFVTAAVALKWHIQGRGEMCAGIWL